MIPPPLPHDEEQRLRVLEHYGVLDTAPETRFDRITRLAQRLFGVPIALVSLVDQDRQWFKSCIGLDVRETGRDAAFCAYAILSDEITEVTDPLSDPRFSGNPLVLGAPFIRYYAGAPLRTPDGFHLGTLCIIDTVERPPLTLDQRQVLRDLAHLVIENLELRKLLGTTNESSAEAQAANASKVEFLGWLSHELKTPLTAIQGFADTLLLLDLDERARDFAEHISRAGGRMGDLIGDIMDFARVDAGRLDVDIERVELGPLISEAVTLVRDRAATRGLTIEWHGTDASVYGDERRILQVLTNLLSNGVKYNRDGGRVVVDVEVGDAEVALHVRDTGLGIAPDHVESVFEAFERVPGTGQPGAGIGLTLARWLARAMDGDLVLAATGPEGSTFTLTLPAAETTSPRP